MPINPVLIADVAGVVLVGGQSRRMGRDKALVEVDGVSMVARVVAAMRTAGIHDIYAVGGGPDAAAAAGIDPIADAYPGEGPLGGIVTAMATIAASHVLVSAVDLPFVTAAAVDSLLVHCGADVDVVLGNDGDRSQPLFSLINTRVSGSLAAAFTAGVRSPHDAFQSLRSVVADPMLHGQLDDVDTPAELQDAVRDRAMGLRSNPMSELDPEVPEIDIAEFEVRRATGLPVLDVRELDEWQEAHIPGVIHVPLTELIDRVDEVPAVGQLLVVCAKGGRSMNAATWLRSRGIDATNVDGGTDGWIAAGKPTESGQ